MFFSQAASAMTPNGTAVEVVCVTGAANRVLVPVVSSETVPVASQYSLSRFIGSAIFAPGLTERSERQASRCAWALSRSRYKEIVIR